MFGLLLIGFMTFVPPNGPTHNPFRDVRPSMQPQVDAPTVTSFWGLTFDGDDYVLAPPPSPTMLTAWTTECWIKPASLDALDCVWSWGTSPAVVRETPSLYLRSTGQITATIHGAEDFTLSSVVSVGTWVHLAVTTNAAKSMKIYKNGMLIGEQTMASQAPGTDTLFLGCRIGNLYYSEVEIIGFRLWNHERTKSQVAESMLVHEYGVMTGLLIEYPMLPGSGTTCTDNSGNARDGAFGAGTAAPTWTGPYTEIKATGPQE